ncbi:methionine biosynthesis protein MetW [Thermospira aquatica]|uniref:Methionine biosynthesis protein MetW n=1 Tax=Thermospira aquatica TaxID=2828656 RepID=A0AAX3BBW5_9SPIR|nr:methionine biosynthesis protein MetW [Thermospira aquatica]URA09808.1 methionine biosynthesis protein MetW [Thermospira aquatica]
MRRLEEALGMRVDLGVMADWIAQGSKVLDLGCGRGELLSYLIHHKQVRGIGVEIDEESFLACVEKGIPVIQRDINLSLKDVEDQSFDYVIISQTVQQLQRPDLLILESLRIGRYVIVSFPNFGHYRIRLNLLFSGRMPKSKALPYEWYNTPNIHLMTIKDFQDFCHRYQITVHQWYYFWQTRGGKWLLLPNWFASGCLALISRRDEYEKKA